MEFKNILLTDEETKALGTAIQMGLLAEKELSYGEASLIKRADLIEKINKGYAAREKLVMSNSKLVSSMLKPYLNKGLGYDDLFQAGMLGLTIAANKYDPASDNKFTTYAAFWIKEEIFKALNENKAVTIPKNALTELRKFNKALALLREKLNSEPSINEIIEYTKLSKDKVLAYLNYSYSILSLDMEVKEDFTLSDTLADDSSTPYDKVMKDRLYKTLYNAIDTILDDREKYIVTNYFGLKNTEEKSFELIGKEIKLSRERIRQIFNNSILKLQNSCYSEDLKSLFLGS